MKGLTRNVACILAVMLVVNSVGARSEAAENPFKSVWPFNKGKSMPSLTSPLSPRQKPSSDSLLDAPSRFLDIAEKQTSSVMKKTKDGWQGMQKFGRSMNPFSKPKQNKKSFLDTFFPKQPVDKGPATVGEFLNMKRPGF